MRLARASPVDISMSMDKEHISSKKQLVSRLHEKLRT